MQLVAGAGIELEIARQRRRIGPGLLGGLAAVALFDQCQLVGVFGQLARQRHQQAPTFGGGQLAPRPFKAGACGAHGGVDVAFVAALDLVKGLAVGRIDHRQGALADGRDGFVGDEVQLHAAIVA